MQKFKIPFNKPFIIGKELYYISQAVLNGQLAGDGEFTRKCHKSIEKTIGVKKALLTHSCTAALEMSALLINADAGSNVIMPTYTFVSTANAFLLQGIKPVFCDIKEETLNIYENQCLDLINKNTKALVPVHYGGISCDMDILIKGSLSAGIPIIEDAAQAYTSKYNGRFLGSLGDMAAFSFHETKNIISGEGGALIVNSDRYVERAEYIREKGTNRSKFFRGEIDKYTWIDIGSSYLPSELVAAFLYSQLENAYIIQEKREKIYNQYKKNLSRLQARGILRLPDIPEYNKSNYHLFFILTGSLDERTKLLTHLKENDIHAVFHYVPLHVSPMGNKLGYKKGMFPISEKISDTIIRLPFYYDLNDEEIDYISEKIHDFYK